MPRNQQISAASSSGQASTSAQSTSSSDPENDQVATRVLSEDPRIVLSTIALPKAPCFLYLPPGKRDIVLVDRLSSIRSVVSWPVWSEPEPSPPAEPCFRVVDMPGKGKGMVASRPIKAGELIWEERPVVVMRTPIVCLNEQGPKTGIFHRNALKDLSEDSRNAVMSLANAFTPEECDVVPGTLKTNWLQMDLTEEPDPTNTFLGCFPILSRANHSCAPNANYFFSFSKFVGQFWATRDVALDEEITITYANLTDSAAARQAFLKENYRFVCECKICALPPRHLEKSDERRKKLGAWLQVLDVVDSLGESGRKPKVSVQQLQEPLSWAGEERLAVHYAQACLLGTKLLLKGLQPDGFNQFLQWSKKTRTAYKKVEGGKSYNVQKLDVLITRAQDLFRDT